MKAILQNMQTGELRLEEVPPPALQPGGILVSVRRSLISLGTERAVIALAKKGMIGKAKDRPDLVRKVLDKAKQEGLWNTYKVVTNLMASPIPLGYSCAGEAIEVGAEAAEFRVGDRVACAGLSYANHAEINYVPRNLAVKMPDGVSFEDASFVTMGAIALHGVRLAQLELGEKVVVLGLGLVGQIACQLARCAGAVVIASDVDPHKMELAARLGARRVAGDSDGLKRSVHELTGGYGADAVLICAATKSDDLIRQAAELSRLRGRVVVIGDVGLHLERRPYFEKEVSLVISRSYGPGRYDPQFELHGRDYPLPYVRWTERRNMEAFLELLAHKQVDVGALVTHRFPIEQAESAYQLVLGEQPEPAIAILLEYSVEKKQTSRIVLREPVASTPRAAVSLGVIGAGQFAKGILLPAFAAQKSARFRAFCTSSGLTSKHIAEKYGAEYCTSDPAAIWQDERIDAVIIATRHHQHAPLATAAVRAGKAVFVEKPLALTPESLAELREAVETTGNTRVMVGFNRRFAPLAAECRQFFQPRSGPLSIVYRVNAGMVPADSWVLDPVEGGGRILGEVCHFVDFICYLTGSLPCRVFAEALPAAGQSPCRDNVSVTLRMLDGSVGVIHYIANGDTSVPKEYMEVSGGQKMAILDNYRTLSLHGRNRARRRRLLNQAKGHREEVAAFIQALETGAPMPMDFASQVAVTETTFLIHLSLDSGSPVDYEPPGGAPQ